MYQSYIKYPVAYSYTKNTIVPISEVTKENRLNLFCPECKNNLIAVLNHQTPHFKHKPHSTCSGSPETYLHWLTKEVFKEIEKIEIPELFIDDLPEKQRQKFQYNFNKIIDSNVPETFRSIFKKELKKDLSSSRKIVVDKYQSEKGFETELGNVIIDIVAINQNEKIFIEPFFSNPIDEEKKKKLSLINIPTLSLDLQKFIEYYGQNYSIMSLKKYLTSKKSKKWVYLSNEEYDKYIENYEKYLFEEIIRNGDLISSHSLKLKKIESLEIECQKRYKKISLHEEEIDNFRSEISDLKEELGIYY